MDMLTSVLCNETTLKVNINFDGHVMTYIQYMRLYMSHAVYMKKHCHGKEDSASLSCFGTWVCQNLRTICLSNMDVLWSARQRMFIWQQPSRCRVSCQSGKHYVVSIVANFFTLLSEDLNTTLIGRHLSSWWWQSITKEWIWTPKVLWSMRLAMWGMLWELHSPFYPYPLILG